MSKIIKKTIVKKRLTKFNENPIKLFSNVSTKKLRLPITNASQNTVSGIKRIKHPIFFSFFTAKTDLLSCSKFFTINFVNPVLKSILAKLFPFLPDHLIHAEQFIKRTGI